MNHPAPLGPGALLCAEITSGGIGGALWHSLASLPPWIGGAASALIVGALLRLGDPVLRALGDRLAARVTPPPPAPPAAPPPAP